jgi:SET family sugar efflux transporter-like MFS transporter
MEKNDMESGKFLPLFLCNFAILFVGFGVFPLLPVYATRFGATPTLIGFYLAATYISITLGNLLTSWLSGRVPRKVVFVTAGVPGALALFFMGQATSLWQVVVLTSVVWFTGGVGLSLVNVFIGLHADQDSRGKWFSLMALTNPLGAVVGGLAVGWVVAWQGYPMMFTLLGLVYAVWPLVGLWKVQDKPFTKASKPETAKLSSPRSSRSYYLLLLAVLLSAMTVSVVRIGLSLSMQAIHFTPAAIAGANVVGGLVTIPVVLGFGSLSDRLGRRLFLALGYLLAAISGASLLIAEQLWQFWVVAAAVLIARTIGGSLASALATDILPPQTLGRNLPILGTMNWASGVLGFAGSGYVMETLGASNLYLIATLLPLVAAGLMVMLPGRSHEVASDQNRQRLERLTQPVKLK